MAEHPTDPLVVRTLEREQLKPFKEIRVLHDQEELSSYLCGSDEVDDEDLECPLTSELMEIFKKKEKR